MTGNTELIAEGKMRGGIEQELADALEVAEAERDEAQAALLKAGNTFAREGLRLVAERDAAIAVIAEASTAANHSRGDARPAAQTWAQYSADRDAS